MKDLNSTEEMILWAVWKLKDNAYGVTIRKRLSEVVGRVFPYGTIYGVLAKFNRQGLVIQRVGGHSPVRGGRNKNFYFITPKGLSALKEALELKKALWNDESELALREN
ncbi:PadR family transcriptional regulator [Acidobacteriota bacterium]